MNQNQSIVERVHTEFMRRLHESQELSGVANAVSTLISTLDKPKADDFIKAIKREQEEEATKE